MTRKVYPDVDSEVQNRVEALLATYKGSSILYQVLSKLICHTDIVAAFPDLSKLAMILAVLPTTMLQLRAVSVA